MATGAEGVGARVTAAGTGDATVVAVCMGVAASDAGRGVATALAVTPPKSSTTDSAGPMSMMLEQTEQRARTPVPGTLSGSIRKIVRQLTQVTFTVPFLRGWVES